MANKLKQTVDYFPFFVADGRTFYVLKKRFGVLGIGLFTELFRFLSRNPNHYFCIQDDFDCDRLLEFMGTDKETLLDFLQLLTETGKIDYDLWHKKHVIMSEDFNESLTEAYRKRKTEPPTLEDIQNYCKDIPDIEIDETSGILAETCRKPASKGKERKENKSKVNDSEFLVFWEAYPKKVGKKDCLKKYITMQSKNALPDIETHVKIIEQWKLTDKWKSGYQPNPLTWLNGERWNDELPNTTSVLENQSYYKPLPAGAGIKYTS